MKKMYKLFIILIMFIFIFSISNNYIYATAFHDTGDGFEEDEEEVVEKRKENLQEQQQQQQQQQQQPLEKDENIEKAIESANDFLSIGKFLFNKEYSTSDILQNQQSMFNILLLVGTFLAVAVGGVLGIKLMMAAAEEKAKIKEAFTPYILGCVVIFGAFGIWKVTVDIGNSLTKISAVPSSVTESSSKEEIISEINSGKITERDIANFSEEKIKSLYQYLNIVGVYNQGIRGEGAIGMSSKAVQLIYKEAKKRKYINTENGQLIDDIINNMSNKDIEIKINNGSITRNDIKNLSKEKIISLYQVLNILGVYNQGGEMAIEMSTSKAIRYIYDEAKNRGYIENGKLK